LHFQKENGMKTYPTGIKKPENMFICHLVGSMADKSDSASSFNSTTPDRALSRSRVLSL
jgi:hypothetical protein